MFKKTMTFKDFDGNTRTEDFYFHLSEAALIEMRLSVNGGLEKYIEKISSGLDGKNLIETFKDIIKRSYGEKSLDGRDFVQNDAVFERFKSTQAYSDLFMELATDSKKAAEFVNGILPENLREKLKNENNIKPLPGQAPLEVVTPQA